MVSGIDCLNFLEGRRQDHQTTLKQWRLLSIGLFVLGLGTVACSLMGLLPEGEGSLLKIAGYALSCLSAVPITQFSSIRERIRCCENMLSVCKRASESDPESAQKVYSDVYELMKKSA